jgi:tRNA dimethylallyltransferase
MDKNILIISGATCSGKSDLALDFSSIKKAAIINADSLQIYQGLPKLSAQPSEIERKKTDHFLYSYFNWNEQCCVAKWLELVKSLVEQLWQENILPIVVGGSGMYISKMIDGIAKVPEINDDIKKKSVEKFNQSSREDIVKELVSFGEDFNKIKSIDKQRLVRIYEVWLQSGKSLFYWQSFDNKKIFPDANFIHINIEPERKNLYQNCELRFDKMLKNGVIEEVENLLKHGVSKENQITKTLGFNEISDFILQKISFEKMNEIAKQKTRNYAKRQLTWFRHQFAKKFVFQDKNQALEFLKNYEI